MAAVKSNFAVLAKLVADVLVSDDDDGEMSDLQSEEKLGETSDLAVAAVLVTQIIREDQHRARLYIESVVGSYSDEEFRRLFRLQRCTTEVITADFESSSYYPRGRPHDARVLEESFLFEEAASRFDASFGVVFEGLVFFKESRNFRSRPQVTLAKLAMFSKLGRHVGGQHLVAVVAYERKQMRH
ncbi:hypothetical protein MRX96_016887 [Rhipicephalus microplus]